MCVVSFIGDTWRSNLPDRFPWVSDVQKWPHVSTSLVPQPTITPPSREEFERLKKEMEDLKKLLEAAKEYDKASGQPDCEMDEKVELIKRIAEAVGVDINNVFGK